MILSSITCCSQTPQNASRCLTYFFQKNWRRLGIPRICWASKCDRNHNGTSELSSYSGYFQEPHWFSMTLQWRHNGRDSVSNHQPHHCLLNRLFGRRSKKTSKLRVTGLCVENSPGTGEFPAQMASNAEHVSIWWRHHGFSKISRVTW